MKLKDGVTPAQFLKTVDRCHGEVWLYSTQQDRLALRSKLCQYLFITAALQPEALKEYWIECRSEEDAAALSALYTEE